MSGPSLVLLNVPAMARRGLGATLEAMAMQGVCMKYNRMHKVLGEGNFVLTMSEGNFGGRHVAFLRPVPRRARQNRRALGHHRGYST